MATYEILNNQGEVINTILADLDFVEQHYPGHYREITPESKNWAIENKNQAKSLLAETDYVLEADVIDPSRNPHLLNQAEFLDYREEIRKIAVNPPTFVIENWPTKPTNVWSS